MKISHSKLIYFSIFFLYVSCQSPSVMEDTELIQLKDWMTGSFNSSAQAESDSNFFNINLEMVQIWKEDNPLHHLTPDSLSERIGCAITLTFKDGIFTGSTFGKKCSSQLRGATYATSEVRIEENVLTSWDRGFDKNDQQVWGAITGPYIFIKVKDYK